MWPVDLHKHMPKNQNKINLRKYFTKVFVKSVRSQNPNGTYK